MLLGEELFGNRYLSYCGKLTWWDEESNSSWDSCFFCDIRIIAFTDLSMESVAMPFNHWCREGFLLQWQL